ncbi:MAG: hypothetical protein ABSB78_13845 [Bacteroidota bacterium]
MKTYTIFLLFCAAFLVLSSPVSSQTKKYDIKSGIITYENTTTMGTLKMTLKSVVYFDEYGMLECKETYHDNKLVESYFSDGKTLFSVHHDKKTAYNRGKAYRGTEYRYDWSEASQSEKNKVKRLPNVTIAGKNCESFELTSSTGDTIYAGWNHICLLIDVKSSTMEVVYKAIKIEENAKIPADKFKIPTGYKMQ